MGKFDALLKALGVATAEVGDDAAEALARVKTPEVATSLKGEARKQYLDALDSVYGDQATRAKKIGFGDETYYHGTGKDFDKFDPNFHGTHTGPGLTKDRFWITDNPETAEIFSSSSSKLDVMKKYNDQIDDIWRQQSDIAGDLKKTLPKDYDTKRLLSASENDLSIFKKYGDLNDDQIEKIKKLKELNEKESLLNAKKRNELKETSGQIIPLKARLPKNLKEKDMANKYWSESATDIPEGAIKLKNFRESTPLEEAPSAVSIGLQNPARLRSKFAAFDPRFKNSPLLMAGAGAVPMTDISPIEPLKSAYGYYDKLKNLFTDPLANQLDLTKDKSAKDGIKDTLNFAGDPINYIPGPVGIGLGLGQAILTPESDAKSRALDKLMKGK